MKQGTMRLLAVCLLAVVLLAGCTQNSDPRQSVSSLLGADLTGGEIVQEKDTHSGFHGDGSYYLELSFEQETADALAQTLSSAEGWQSCPLSETAKTLLGYLSDELPAVPECENGYWKLIDRFQGDEQEQSTPLLDRASINMSLAVYNADTARLYYVELDT